MNPKTDVMTELKMKMAKSILFMAGMFFEIYMTVKSADFHREWLGALTGKKEKVCIIAPRGHGKSVVISLFYVVWRILFTDSHYIILVSNTIDKASNTLLKPIRDFFETNKLVNAFFGNLIPSRAESGAWGQRSLEFYFRNHNGEVIDKKKIQVFGVGQSVRGTRFLQYRPDTVIADDIEDDEQVDSEKRRLEIQDWFWEQVYPAMDKQGDVGSDGVVACDVKMVVVGTILHYDSFLINIWKTNRAILSEGKNDEWEVLKYSCVYTDKNGKRRALWDTRYTVDYWDKKREEFKKNGREASFMQEYMNEPMSDEERPIKVELLQYYDRDSFDSEGLDKYLSVDLAGANTDKRGGDRRDYNVVMVIGVDRNEGRIYVLDYSKFQTDDLNMTVNEIFSKYMEWRPKAAVYEKSAQQGYLEQMVRSEMQKRGIYFNLMPKTPENIKKEERIRQVVGFNVGRRCLYISKTMKDLYDEMYSFPRGKLKDLVDALAYAILASDNGGSNFKNYLKNQTRLIMKKLRYHDDDLDNPYRRNNNRKSSFKHYRY